MTAIVDAEEALRKGKKSARIYDEEDLKGNDLDGLIKEEHLDLFLTWYAFGGAQKGISISELMTLPADVLADFSYILRILGQIQGVSGDN